MTTHSNTKEFLLNLAKKQNFTVEEERLVKEFIHNFNMEEESEYEDKDYYALVIMGNKIFSRKIEGQKEPKIDYSVVNGLVGWWFESVPRTVCPVDFQYMVKKYSLAVRIPELPIGELNCLGLYGNIAIMKNVSVKDEDGEDAYDWHAFTLEEANKIKSKFYLADGGMLEELGLGDREVPKTPPPLSRKLGKVEIISGEDEIKKFREEQRKVNKNNLLNLKKFKKDRTKCVNCNKQTKKGKKKTGKKCGKCKKVIYCSKKCQREHWKIHNKECK